jgi:hypothetical protein
MTTIIPGSDMPITDLDLDSSYMDDLAGLSPEELVEKERETREAAKKRKMTSKRPSDEYCEAEVNKLAAIYPELGLSSSAHWSLVLIRMINVTGYKPSSREILLRQSSLPVNLNDLSATQLVQKHMSIACFNEIVNHVGEWAVNNPEQLEEAGKGISSVKDLLGENNDDDIQDVVASAPSDELERANLSTATVTTREIDQSHPLWGEW